MGVSYNACIVTDKLISVFDAANPKSFSPNVHPNPTDIYSWVNSTVGNACNLSRDTIASPVGNTPLKMAVTGNDPYTNTYNSPTWNICPTTVGDTWTVSVWLKASVATTCELWLIEANSSGGYLQGVVGAYSNPDLTTQWQRFTVSGTVGNVSTANLQWRFDGTNISGAGITIWIDGVQIERGLSMTAFNPRSNTNGVNWWDPISNNTSILVNKPAYSNGALMFAYTSSQQVNVPGSNYNFLGTSPYTLEAWVFPTRNPGANNWTGIFDRESNPGSGRDGYNLYFLGSATTATYFVSDRWATGTGVFPTINVDSSQSVNAWQHIVAVYDGTSISLYRNSVLGQSLASTGSITNASKTLTIGVRGGQYFDGKISNAKFYNKALSASEIQQNFNALRGRFGI